MLNQNLQRFDNDGLELIINTDTGEVFASQRAISRMVDKALSTVQNFLSKADRNIQAVNAQVKTDSGVQGVLLYDENTVYEVFAKYKPELLIQCAKAGIRVYLHTLAGFKVTSTAAAKELSPLEILEQQVRLMRQHQEDLDRVKLQVQQLNEFKQEIEDTQKEAITHLKALPQATCVAQPIVQKELLNRLIRDYSIAKSLSYGYVYNWVYREFRDRYHIDLKVRGNNSKPKLTGIEYADKNNLTDKLYAVAQEVLVV